MVAVEILHECYEDRAIFSPSFSFFPFFSCIHLTSLIMIRPSNSSSRLAPSMNEDIACILCCVEVFLIDWFKDLQGADNGRQQFNGVCQDHYSYLRVDDSWTQ